MLAVPSPYLAHVHAADQDLPRLLQSLLTTFHRGGSKPKVVRHGSPCARRVFSTDGQCLRVAQSDSTLGHTKDRSGGPLPVCYRHGGKRWDWPSRTWDRSDSSKNLVPNTWNRSKRTPLFMMRRSTTRGKGEARGATSSYLEQIYSTVTPPTGCY